MTPNTRGALLMMASMAAFTLNDSLMKFAGASVPLFQMVTLRGVLATVLIFLLAVRVGGLRFNIGKRDWVLIGVRCVGEVVTTYFFLTALLHMPLANLTAVLQALPLTVTLGAALFLGESVGWRRMAAILIGFVGMLLIVRPGPDGFSIYSLYAVAAVAMVTLRDLVTRRMSPDVPSLTVTLITALSVTLAAALASASITWEPMSIGTVGAITSASVFILIGYLCSVMVMRSGDIAAIAPFRYTSLVWALILGWVMFGDWPDALTLAGAGLIVVTGLFTLFRGRRKLG
jgi:drug/metabolite transporter (DMT)-like permease